MMEAVEAIDLLEIGRKEWKKGIDPRFRMTRWVEDVETGAVFCHLDYIAEKGFSATGQVKVERELLEQFTADQLVDYASWSIADANEGLQEYIQKVLT